MANHHKAGVGQGHMAEANDSKKAKPLSGEDKVVICFSLLGLVGSVPLYFLGLPSVVTSMFLSAGITALVYRFLGGIQGAKFSVGALKLGGTLAALIGIAFWINSTKLERRFHLVSDDAVVGEWQWDVVGPGSSWDGHLDFAKDHGRLTFSGKEYTVDKTADGAKRTLLLEMTNGKAAITDGDGLTLESDVTDHQYGRTFHWRSVAPFALTPAFVGDLRPEKHDDPNLESKPWGMLIYKKAEKRVD